MSFYKVLIGDLSFHGNEALTYHADEKIVPGTLVRVPLRNRDVLGVVEGYANRPSFATKAVLSVEAAYKLPAASLKLMAWLQSYYPAPLGTIVQLFVSSRMTKIKESTEVKIAGSLSSIQQYSLPDALPLNADQTTSIEHIFGDKKSSTYLLHGETGSGKTRIYLELARQTLASGKSVIMLTPEISLTPQLTKQFTDYFGPLVLLSHSNMTVTERKHVWYEALASNTAKQPRVIIGPRSALFMPLANVGLIILDEAHEAAYKQEQAPRYQTVRAAAALSGIHRAKLVLGTATPSITDYYFAQRKQLPVLRLQKLATQTDRQPVTVDLIDLRNKELFTTSHYISQPLLEAVRATVDRGEQALLFLNRRGTARIVMCEQCGWQAMCPTCDLPLTYHGDKHLMLCHTCGFKQATPSSCPECGHAGIIFKSFGTKALADFFTKQFPHKTLARFDLDNKKTERIEAHYEDLVDGKIDIIVGTQILAKGLDLPKLGLVGVVLADTSLYIPDYSSDERTWQLLHQVIGRVGRGHRPGRVIIQTYHPENPAIGAAISREWENFYEQQLEERRLFSFPPFTYILKLSGTRKSPKAAETAAKKLKTQLLELRLPIAIEGPAPSFHEKQAGNYSWQLIVKAKKRSYLTEIVAHLPANWTYDLDPNNLL